MARGGWVYVGGRAGNKPPAGEKSVITATCEKFIVDVLKPRFLPKIRPTKFNYPIAIYGKWHGNKYRFITRYRNAQAPVPPEKELAAAALRKQLDGGAHLLRHPWARMAWAKGKRGATLFVNGHAYLAPAELAERLSGASELAPGKALEEAELAVLLALVNDGHLVVHKPRRR